MSFDWSFLLVRFNSCNISFCNDLCCTVPNKNSKLYNVWHKSPNFACFDPFAQLQRLNLEHCATRLTTVNFVCKNDVLNRFYSRLWCGRYQRFEYFIDWMKNSGRLQIHIRNLKLWKYVIVCCMPLVLALIDPAACCTHPTFAKPQRSFSAGTLLIKTNTDTKIPITSTTCSLQFHLVQSFVADKEISTLGGWGGWYIGH